MKHITQFAKKQYQAIPNAAKASIAFAICSIAQKGIQFVSVPLFTRVLTKEQYGQFSLYQTWLSTISIFATLNLAMGVFNNGMTKFSEDRAGYIASMQGLSTVSVLLCFAGYLLFKEWAEVLTGLPMIIMCGIFLELLLSPALSYWSTAQRYEYKYKMLVVVTLAVAILNPSLGLLAVQCTTEKGIARTLSVVLLNCTVGCAFYIRNFYKGKKFCVPQYWKFALAFNLPLIPHYLSQLILSQSDRIMIEKMFGTSELAVYSLACSLGAVMTIVGTSVNSSFIPWTYHSCADDQFEKVGKTSILLLGLMAFVSLMPVMMAPEIVKIMGPPEYADATLAIPPIAMATYLVFVYGLFGNIEFYFEESKFVMVASCIAAAVNLLLNWIFMPIFGYMAAAYTTVICYLLLAAAHYWFMRLILKRQHVESTVYNLRIIILITAGLSIAMACIVFLYPYPLARYGLVVIAVIVAFIKRNSAMQLLKNIKTSRML